MHGVELFSSSTFQWTEQNDNIGPKQVDFHFEDPQSLLAQATESATLAWDHQPSANISLCTPMQNKDRANHCNTADIPHVEQSLGPDLFDFLHE